MVLLCGDDHDGVSGGVRVVLVGRKGGGVGAPRFPRRHIDRPSSGFGAGAPLLIVPAMPPPMPFKLFVLLAGVSGVQLAISGAIVLGAACYGGEAYLARW
jgi:hypothetical protein